MMKFFLFTSLIFLLTFPALAQRNRVIRVQDSLTREPVIGATVRTPSYVKPLVGNVTDTNGMTTLANLPASVTALTVSAVGYKSGSFPIVAGSDTLIFSLKSADESLDEVTVSATRTNSRIEDLPIKVEVLGQEDMNEESAVVPGNISSILGDISIIHVQRTSAVNGNQAIRMQGLDPKYTQILRDGLPLYEGFSGNLGVLQIPPLDLKQIEVVKGSVSTLYGGGAIGGLINIVSKSPTSAKPEFTVLINRSGLKESNSNAYYAQRYGKTGLTLFAGYTNQQAVDVTGDGFTDSPGIRQFTIHPRFFWNPSDRSRFNIGYAFTNEYREGGYLPRLDGIAAVNTYQNITDLQRHTVDFDASHNTAETNSITFKGALSTFHRKNVDYQQLSDGRQSSVYLETNDLKRFGKQQLIIGANLTIEAFRKGLDSTRLVDYTYSTVGAFVQDDWQVDEKVSLQAGLRLDHHNTFGNFLLPRLSVKLKPSDPWTMRLSVGTGYKTPNLFVNQTPGAPNVSLIFPRLLPIDVANVNAERSVGTNMDIAYSKTFESGFSIQVDQAFYYTRINTPVVAQFASLSGTLGAYTNLVNAPYNVFSVGTDTYVRLHYKSFELYLGYNHTLAKRADPNSTDVANNSYLPLAPQDKFSTTLAWENEHFRFGVESSFVGRQYLYNNERVRNYWIVAGAAEYHYNEHWRLVLNTENALNVKQANYETVVTGTNPTVQPTFRPVWAPLEGIIVNAALKYTL